jgi:hypothetical protein
MNSKIPYGSWRSAFSTDGVGVARILSHKVGERPRVKLVKTHNFVLIEFFSIVDSNNGIKPAEADLSVISGRPESAIALPDIAIDQL